MIITRDMLHTDTPEVKENNGYTNCVLALLKDDQFCESNTNMPKWIISNTAYYAQNPDKFEGWIELEFLIPNLENSNYNCEQCKFCEGS